MANCLDINYGLPQTKFLKHFAKYALLNADSMLPISKSSETELLAFVRPKHHNMVHCCVQCDAVQKEPDKKKQVLTVDEVSRISSRRRGHFAFVEVAKHLPEVKFILVGKPLDDTIDQLREAAPPNVEFLDYIETPRLIELYRETKVYLQLSRHEGFGISVAESMWHGCTPVVSHNGSLSEIVRDIGVILPDLDAQHVASKIDEVLRTFPDVSRNAMKQAQTFPVEKRKTELYAEVDRLTADRLTS